MAGPITGIVDYKERFAEVEAKLRSAGYGVINPTTLEHKDHGDWLACMRLDIATMMREADGVALLDGWRESRGARIEEQLAYTLGMQVETVECWYRTVRFWR